MNLSFEFASSEIVNGARVRQAREQALLTQTDLADATGVTQPMIAHVEQGLKQPSPELARRIANETGVGIAFLRKPDIAALPYGSMLFRARANTSQKKFAQIHAIACTAFEIFQALSADFQLPRLRLHSFQGRPDEAAIETRKMLSIPENVPVSHLMRSFEKAGGVLLALPELEGREAFAVWASGRPVVAFVPTRSADRMRFSVAHEIGHLVLHTSPALKKLAEREAHNFAAEFLMPKDGITEDLEQGLTLARLGELKMKWGVSMATLLRRAQELSLISKRNFDSLSKELQPFRTSEPTRYDVPMEKPRLLRQMAEEFVDAAGGWSSLAEKLALSESFLVDFLSRYASRDDISASARRAKVVPIARGVRNRPKLPRR